MSHEDQLRAVRNDVREAQERINQAMRMLHAKRFDACLTELEIAQKALFTAERQGRP